MLQQCRHKQQHIYLPCSCFVWLYNRFNAFIFAWKKVHLSPPRNFLIFVLRPVDFRNAFCVAGGAFERPWVAAPRPGKFPRFVAAAADRQQCAVITARALQRCLLVSRPPLALSCRCCSRWSTGDRVWQQRRSKAKPVAGKHSVSRVDRLRYVTLRHPPPISGYFWKQCDWL